MFAPGVVPIPPSCRDIRDCGAYAVPVAKAAIVQCFQYERLVFEDKLILLEVTIDSILVRTAPKSSIVVISIHGSTDDVRSEKMNDDEKRMYGTLYKCQRCGKWLQYDTGLCDYCRGKVNQ